MNINELIALADRLDKAGRHDEADMIDKMLQKTAEEEKDPLEGIDPMLEESINQKNEWGGERTPEEREYMGEEEVARELSEPGENGSFPKTPAEFLDFSAMHNYNIRERSDLALKYPDQAERMLKKNLEDALTMLEVIENIKRLESSVSTNEGVSGLSDESQKLEQTSGSTNVIFEKLANVADKLDSIGASEEANLVDSFIEKHAEGFLDYQGDSDTEQGKRYDSKYHHSIQIRESKEERKDIEGRGKHHVHTQQHAVSTALNTRYCPEHIGVMTGRIGENIYQCPIDGKTFNSETGWVDYDGNVHPGGSVAAQTPDSTSYETSHRIFDSRENTLNAVN